MTCCAQEAALVGGSGATGGPWGFQGNSGSLCTPAARGPQTRSPHPRKWQHGALRPPVPGEGSQQPGACVLPLGPSAGLAPRVRLEEGLVPSWLLRHRPCEAASGLRCQGGVLGDWARGPGRSSTTPAVDSKCIFASFFFFFQICILQALTSPAESNLFKLHLLQCFPMFQGALSMGHRTSISPDLDQDTRWRGDNAEFGITQTSVRILLLPSSLSQ